MKKVAILSDTHRLLRSEVISHLKDVEHIFHAGDVGKVEILEKLRQYAPLTAVQGNMDYHSFGLSYYEMTEVEGINFYIRHIEEHIQLSPKAAGIDVVITGHTHKAHIQQVEDVLFLNPGSAGPKRGKIPATMMILHIHDDGKLEPEIIQLTK